MLISFQNIVLNYKNIVIIMLLILLFSACKKITKATDFITKPSAREVYKRELVKDSSLLGRWESEFAMAKNDSVTTKLPYVESGRFWPNDLTASGYTIYLQQGERFYAEIRTDSVKIGCFWHFLGLLQIRFPH